SVIAEYEARIAALERKVGQLTMELDLVKKTPRAPTASGSERPCVISGPVPVPSGGGAKS
ncbi:transposase, partial [Cereibacter sphaeroides]|nr:transposase [Cereibacter sphaeroides]MCE6971041.1 transposase [Cereibacter sphaeroides]